MMSQRKFYPVFILVLMAIGLVQCKKEDFQKPPTFSDRYFQTSPETPLLIRQIALRIQAQNKEKKILDELINKDGYALWNKSKIINSGNETVAYIPLVLQHTDYVNSYIVYKQNDYNSVLKLIRGSRYLSYGFGTGFSANTVALDLMYLNQQVFGDSIFEIKDGNLLGLKNRTGIKTPYIVRFGSAKLYQEPASTIPGLPYQGSFDPATYSNESLVLPAPCQRSISLEKCSGFISESGPKNCKNIFVSYTAGGACSLPPLGPASGPGEGGGSVSSGPSGGGGIGFAGLPGLNMIMPPCPVGMSQQVCDERMVPVMRYLERDQSDLAFNDIDSPVDEPDEDVIQNGIDVEDIKQDAPPGDNPRIIAKTENRGNKEDLEFGTNGDASGIAIFEQAKNDGELFNGMKDLFWKCTILDGELSDVGNVMIEKFKTNTSIENIFQNPVLNSKVLQSNTTTNFLKRFGDVLQTELKKTGGNINSVGTLPLSARPRFNGTYNKFHGLQILINDTEYTEVQLDNFQLHPSGEWAAEVTVFINDHFGLDKNDAVTYQSYHRGFADWWLLQHTRGYVPFKTKIVIRKRIIGHL